MVYLVYLEKLDQLVSMVDADYQVNREKVESLDKMGSLVPLENQDQED
jgi:hypothetical protein